MKKLEFIDSGLVENVCYACLHSVWYPAHPKVSRILILQIMIISQKGVFNDSSHQHLQSPNLFQNSWIQDLWNYHMSKKSSFDLIVFFNYSNYFPTTVASTYNRQSNKPNFQDGLAQSVLIYDPRCREQIWRFFTYMFLHGDPIHLGFNLALQLLVGKFILKSLLTFPACF